MTIKYYHSLLLLMCLMVCGCSGQLYNSVTISKKANNIECGNSVEPYQKKLIEIAYNTAMAIPVDPFAKVRSANLEKIVDECLALGLIDEALGYTDDIPDWRKGNCFGKAAVYYAKKSDVDRAGDYITLAQGYYDDNQQWRNDQINVKLAEAYAWLGDYDKSQELCDTFEQESLVAEIVVVKILSGYCSFDYGVRELDKYFILEKYLPVMDSLSAYLKLYDKYYDQADRRELIENKVKSGFKTIAHIYRYMFLKELSEVALAHGDRDKAQSFISEMVDIVDGVKWRLEDEISLRARLVSLNYRSGNVQNADEKLLQIKQKLDSDLDSIIDIYRAGPERFIAEAYSVTGNKKQALVEYGWALELGMVNLNLRPRAESLVQTCCDMAVNGIEPDASMWNNIGKIYKDMCK